MKLYHVNGAADDPIVIALGSHLKALVFDPDFYYGGIEAFDFSTYTYNPLTMAKVDANGDYSEDAPEVASESFTMSPDLAATYFLNPSNAKMSADKSKYSFIAYNKAYTRAGRDISSFFSIQSADLKTAGKVTVHAKYNGNVIKNLSDSVSVLALQYTSNDTTVTSDFAAVRANVYNDLRLNNPKKNERLYRSANVEISRRNPSIELAWNNDKGIDLREYVNTVRRLKTGDNPLNYVAWDENATKQTVKDAGFKYSFELVGWHAGDNKTSESAHAAIASDGYTLRAQMPNNGKQQAYGYNAEEKNNLQNKATIGRLPLVRVLLTDTVNNKVVAAGYIKIKIVSEVSNTELTTYEAPEATDTYTIACGDGKVFTQTLTWHEVEEKIIAKLNMSKEEFEANYTLDGTTETSNVAKQFDNNTDAAEEVAKANQIGEVTKTVTDQAGHQTEVLEWTINNQKAYSLFSAKDKDNNAITSVSTYVRFKRTGSSGAYEYFYVKFTWTPSAINLTPATTFSDSNKLEGYWYAANNSTARTGYDEIHGNVEVVASTGNKVNGATTDGADDEYVFNISNTLLGQKLAVDKLVAPYAKLNDDLALTFAFVDGNGLYASDDGKQVFAEKSKKNVVATLDPSTGVVTYQNNATAKELLNANSNADLSKVVTAKVAVVAKICGNIEVPVSNNTFNVKFLRPVDVENASATFKDAETGGSTSELKLTFKDWRGHDFANKSVTKGNNYWQYYDVSAIALDIDNAYTNLAGGSKKLSEVAPSLKFTFSAPTAANIKAGKFGSITYTNNGQSVGDFTVDIPANITYHWGVIKTTVKCKITGTTVQAKRR